MRKKRGGTKKGTNRGREAFSWGISGERMETGAHSPFFIYFFRSLGFISVFSVIASLFSFFLFYISVLTPVSFFLPSEFTVITRN